MNLHEFLDNQEETEKESFQVTDDNAANWALRKIKQHQEQQKENNSLAESEIEKIKSWLSAENGQAQQSIDYFQGLLAAYALQKRDNDPKFKSLKLPNGQLSFRKQQPKWSLDKETIIQSLKDADATNLIKVTEEPKLADIKKAFKVQDGKAINPETGEVIVGIVIEEQPDKFGVKFDEHN